MINGEHYISYPAQTHLNHKFLRNFLAHSGKKKPIVKYDLLNKNQDSRGTDEFQNINLILNNFFDIEFYRSLIINPSNANRIVNNPYFECMGHSYEIAYSSVLWLLCSTFDANCDYFPDPRLWENEFKRLRDDKVTNFYYGSNINISQIGLKEIFEGQARFNQLQYLYFGSNENLEWIDFQNLGMLSGVYIKAFELFLEFTESEYPESIGNPLVALFLLVCDLSINPTDGFPFNLCHFESFIESTDPGIRFYFICRFIANEYPYLKQHIINYSKDEYIEVSEILSKATVCRSPLEAASKVVEWSKECPTLIDLLKQGETFDFSDENLPVRVIFERYIRFCEDKIASPEFFCWTGAWTAGERVSEDIMRIFEKQQALFSDGADGDIYPKSFPDKDEKLVSNTFNAFYAWIITYDLCRQWILEEGPFHFFFYWLSNKPDLDTYRTWASNIFKSIFNVDPNDFEIL